MSGELKEYCAVAGASVMDSDEAANLLSQQLLPMEHRGDQGTGIISNKETGEMVAHHSYNSVRYGYSGEDIARLAAGTAIGHCLYSTSGSKVRPGPFGDEASGTALSHNGTIAVTESMDSHLEKQGLIPQHANDSEKMLMIIAQEIRMGYDLPTAIERVNHLFTGAYACVTMHKDMMVAFRDPHGIRPLSIGERDDGIFVASETCGLYSIDAINKIRDVEPGEMVIIQDGQTESRRFAEANPMLDIFELIYFAREDSLMLDKSVSAYRRAFGRELAHEHPPSIENHDDVVVVGVPDTAIQAAEAYANELKLQRTSAIVKTRGSGRTFMMAGDHRRDQQAKRKYSILSEQVAGKHVMLIDDSLVRGNTVPRLVKRLNEAGALSINVLICCPPIRYPDYYGIATPTQKELPAAHMTVEAMCKEYGADYLGFLSLQGMIKATGLPETRFNLSCFNGIYPIDIGHNNQLTKKPSSMEFVDY